MNRKGAPPAGNSGGSGFDFGVSVSGFGGSSSNGGGFGNGDSVYVPPPQVTSFVGFILGNNSLDLSAYVNPIMDVGPGDPANNDPCGALCQAVFHSPQAQNTWKQADCTINGPATEAIKGVADGLGADSVKGALTAGSAGTSVVKGIVDSVKEGTLTFAFGIYSYGKMMYQVGRNMVMGCKGD